ncbi:MAG: YbjN domain-containing protein [Tannerella sp.]|nr:YbjN domain-containing protein [Tannerella sp.]
MLNEILKEFFKEQDWTYSEITGKDTFVFGINGKSGQFQCIMELFENEKRILFASVLGVNVPEDKMNDMLQFINILNVKIFSGNFIIKPDTRELRFKTSLSVSNIKPTKKIIEEVVMTNIIAMDAHLQYFIDLIFEKHTLEEVLQITQKKK